MPGAAQSSSKWNPPNCAYRLYHLKASRNGGHAASLRGVVSKGGGSKLTSSRAVDAYLGVDDFADDAAPTGFLCDKDRPVRTLVLLALTTPRQSPALLPRQSPALLPCMHAPHDRRWSMSL